MQLGESRALARVLSVPSPASSSVPTPCPAQIWALRVVWFDLVLSLLEDRHKMF